MLLASFSFVMPALAETAPTQPITVGLGSHGTDPSDGPNAKQLTVDTYNLYLGADLTPIITAPDRQEMVRRTRIAYEHVLWADFPARARAIARLLARQRPDVLGLQEVALWKEGPIGGPLRTTVDYLPILLKALEKYGLNYEVAAENTNFSGQLPISATRQVSFTDHDAILVRTDTPGRWRVSHSESHEYVARLTVPTAAGPFTIPYGWSAVDVTARGRTVRVANTHLEPTSPQIRNAQANELHAALATAAHPVVLLGDLNSPPSDSAGPYGQFTQGGYTDAWAAIHGPAGGFTAMQIELDAVPSTLDRRIDYVLYRPTHPEHPDLEQVRAARAIVIGDKLRDRTPSGLWPSDHASVVAALAISRQRHYPHNVSAAHRNTRSTFSGSVA
ncbi:endonuclease/exonuclease/phosphatase family protein [Frankia gtarii]|uniref:endonuclease/exonuclease/phosphatase family protein n=1 Tax=Frankia gtarii TaxID=2950102 RepID=UPI0021C1B4BC|nr:endonuclease/exonuclease/phosphatase family protein [Frankia gtarii]